MRRYILGISLFFIFNTAQAVPDSIGTAEFESHTYVIHMVDAKETLYSISNKYKVTVEDIVLANKLENPTIFVGQVLKIPMQAEEIPLMEPISGDDQFRSAPPVEKEASAQMHTVAPGQTLYAIAKMYEGVSPVNIKEWNGLLSDTILIGQTLEIQPAGKHLSTTVIPSHSDQVIIKPEKNQDVVVQPATEGQPHLDEAAIKPDKELMEIKPKVYQSKSQVGSALFIETPTKRSEGVVYALHPEAVIGSTIKITNMLNKKTITAKVIGRFEDKGDATVVKLSSNAEKRLAAKDQRLMVNVDYLVE